MDLENSLYSTTYNVLEGGGVEMVVATVEHGEIIRLGFRQEDALANVRAFAAAQGLVVAKPL